MTLIAALAIVSSVACYAEEMTRTEMACCAAMAHDCGRMAAADECCTTEAPRAEQGSTVARVAIDPPSVALIAVLTAPPVIETVSTSTFTVASLASIKPPGIPTYLAVSSLRI
jgi:hypothetical protein